VSGSVAESRASYSGSKWISGCFSDHDYCLVLPGGVDLGLVFYLLFVHHLEVVVVEHD